MTIVAWIIVGLIAGWLASLVMHSRQGVVTDIIMGIIGAFVGGFIMSLVGNSGVTGFNIYSIIVAALGAIVVIWVGRRVF